MKHFLRFGSSQPGRWRGSRKLRDNRIKTSLSILTSLNPSQQHADPVLEVLRAAGTSQTY